MRKRRLFRFREPPTERLPVPAAAPPESLAGLLAAGPLSLAQALRYGIALGEALREFHRRGRVYAFLDPAGIAVLENELRLVSPGPVGTTPYFSPEQVAGGGMDPRSDIFSLGAVLYLMLSGRPAFEGASKPALRMEILHRDPPPLANMPVAVARLVRRCLEKKPERRFQRMEILLAELKLLAIQCGASASNAGADKTETAGVCRMCGARDVHRSAPAGWRERLVMRLGGEVGICYRCFHRSARIGWFTAGRAHDPNARQPPLQ